MNAATKSYADGLALARAREFSDKQTSTSALVDLVIANPEGTLIGDAAWIALTDREGFLRSIEIVKAERDARATERWADDLDRLAAKLMAE